MTRTDWVKNNLNSVVGGNYWNSSIKVTYVDQVRFGTCNLTCKHITNLVVDHRKIHDTLTIYVFSEHGVYMNHKVWSNTKRI